LARVSFDKLRMTVLMQWRSANNSVTLNIGGTLSLSKGAATHCR
jgi:hypothetical protein